MLFFISKFFYSNFSYLKFFTNRGVITPRYRMEDYGEGAVCGVNEKELKESLSKYQL